MLKSAQTGDDVTPHRYLIQQSPNSPYRTRKRRLWAAAAALALHHLNSAVVFAGSITSVSDSSHARSKDRSRRTADAPCHVQYFNHYRHNLRLVMDRAKKQCMEGVSSSDSFRIKEEKFAVINCKRCNLKWINMTWIADKITQIFPDSSKMFVVILLGYDSDISETKQCYCIKTTVPKFHSTILNG